jgi:hypothetical protein
MNDEEIYVHLGRLIESMPNLENFGSNKDECMVWLARAYAINLLGNDIQDRVQFKTSQAHFVSGSTAHMRVAARTIHSILLRQLAVLELRVAPASKGTFIPVGSSFDAFTAIAQIFSSAQTDILIVDPYMDSKILTDFAPTIRDNVQTRLLSDQQTHKPDLISAAAFWKAQYQTARPMSVRLSAPRQLHDCLILTDNLNAWTVTQSFKDIALRSPASIVKSDLGTTNLKVDSYGAMWSLASVVQ